MRFSHYIINRTYCDVIKELKDIITDSSVSTWESQKPVMISLLHELQTYGNRMEAALETQKDLRELQDEVSELKKKWKEAKAQDKGLDG